MKNEMYKKSLDNLIDKVKIKSASMKPRAVAFAIESI
jgi:hypothetical protein